MKFRSWPLLHCAVSVTGRLVLPLSFCLVFGFLFPSQSIAQEAKAAQNATLQETGAEKSKSVAAKNGTAASEEQASGNSKDKSKDNSSLKGILSPEDKGKDLPVFIKSNTLSLDSKQQVFTYSGNVEIVRGDMKITADSVIGAYDDKNELQTIVCDDNVVVTRGTELRASANHALYKVPQAIIELTEGPELERRGNILSADKITVYVDEDRSDAEGDVRVKVISTEEASGVGAAKDKLKTPSSSSQSKRGDS